MLAVSAIKNNAKPAPPYSTKYPATNSFSASGKSNGGRFVSARAEIKNIINKGNSGITKKISSCATTISEKLNDPTQTNTDITIKPIETS